MILTLETAVLRRKHDAEDEDAPSGSQAVRQDGHGKIKRNRAFKTICRRKTSKRKRRSAKRFDEQGDVGGRAN